MFYRAFYFLFSSDCASPSLDGSRKVERPGSPREPSGGVIPVSSRDVPRKSKRSTLSFDQVSKGCVNPGPPGHSCRGQRCTNADHDKRGLQRHSEVKVGRKQFEEAAVANSCSRHQKPTVTWV